MMSIAPDHEVDWPQAAGISRQICAETDQPLLDPIALEKLREDLAGFEIWSVFVQNFLTALPRRIENLRLALTTGDAVGAMDAVLSLKTASQMVGASRLATLARGLEIAVREGIRVAKPSVVLPWLAAKHLQQIKQHAEQTSYALGTHLEAAGRAQPHCMRPAGVPDGSKGFPRSPQETGPHGNDSTG